MLILHWLTKRCLCSLVGCLSSVSFQSIWCFRGCIFSSERTFVRIQSFTWFSKTKNWIVQRLTAHLESHTTNNGISNMFKKNDDQCNCNLPQISSISHQRCSSTLRRGKDVNNCANSFFPFAIEFRRNFGHLQQAVMEKWLVVECWQWW